MKKLIFIIFLFSGLGLKAQYNKVMPLDSLPTKNVYLGIVGDAALISFNVERVYNVNPFFRVTSRLGLGYFQELRACILGPCAGSPNVYISVPHHITGSFGKGIHYFEFGIGATFLLGTGRDHYLMYPLIGYRLFPLSKNKPSIRLYLHLPFTGLYNDDFFFMPAGFTIGKSF